MATFTTRTRLLHFVLLVRLVQSQLDPDGINVCSDTVYRTVSKRVLVTYTETQNCDGRPPPCERIRYEIQYEEKETVERRRCCKGWIRTGNNCSEPCPSNTYGDYCSSNCNCTGSNTQCNPSFGCLCQPGWKTPNCSVPCDPGSHGYNCIYNCTCQNGAACDPTDGSCSCTPGWIGRSCDTSCPEGRFGANCDGNCSCDIGATCDLDHVTGNCSFPLGCMGPNCDTTYPNGANCSDHRHLIVIITSLVGVLAILSVII